MASPKDLIDLTLNFYDDVDASDGDNATSRARLLVFLQHLYSFVHNYLPWQWTYAETDVVVAANDNTGALPTNYMELSRNGSVFFGTTQYFERSRWEVGRRRTASGGSDASTIFAVWDGNMQLPFTASAQMTFNWLYRVAAETLVDNTTALVMPDKYARTVLLPALVYQAQEGKNDARDTWGAQFREGLSQMAQIEFPEKTARRKMPLANRGW